MGDIRGQNEKKSGQRIEGKQPVFGAAGVMVRLIKIFFPFCSPFDDECGFDLTEILNIFHIYPKTDCIIFNRNGTDI